MFNIFRRKENSQNNKIGTLADRLEGAKQKLIADLEKNGMEFLVKSMACNDDYSELIEERRNIARSYGSEDRVWWYAKKRETVLKFASKPIIALNTFVLRRHRLYYFQYLEMMTIRQSVRNNKPAGLFILFVLFVVYVLQGVEAVSPPFIGIHFGFPGVAIANASDNPFFGRKGRVGKFEVFGKRLFIGF